MRINIQDLISEIAPKGMHWVFCRFRRAKNSNRKLDAWDYGYNCWAFLAKDKK